MQTFKCRCSSISKLLSNSRSNPVLTELQVKELDGLREKLDLTSKQKDRYTELRIKEENGKKVILSDSCIEVLMLWYAWETEGMIATGKESLDILAMKHGKQAEMESIALLSIYDGELYLQHKERIENDYLSGEIDCYLGKDVYSATNVTDIKNCFDYPTFLKKIHTEVENGHEFQLGGYGDITGAKELHIAYTVVNASQEILEDMKYKVAKKLGALTTESPEFLEEWKKWYRSMVFSDMNPKKRVHKIKVEPFSEIRRQQVYDRVKICREWLENTKTMSLFLEDAERLYRDADYALNSANADLSHCKEMVERNPTEENKIWLGNARIKESIMRNVISELVDLVKITQEEEQMMNK